MTDTLPPPKDLNESAVLIVGGTSGVGLETARQLCDAGVRRIVIVGRDSTRGQKAIASLGREQITYLAGAAADAGGAATIARMAAAHLGAIDILVNATAPNVLPGLFQDQPIEEIARVLTSLTLAPMQMTSAVLPFMRVQRRGVIVNIASDAAKVPTPGEGCNRRSHGGHRHVHSHDCDGGKARRHSRQRADAVADRWYRNRGASAQGRIQRQALSEGRFDGAPRRRGTC